MKTKILSILRQTEGYVSGQELCELLGVSRTAVWKSIKKLEEEGYEIEGLNRKGYRLIESPDVVTAQEIEACLKNIESMGTGLRFKVKYAPEVDSTNTWAKREAENGAPEGTVLVADMQTAL